MPALRRSPDVPPPLGATLTASGAEFAVYAGHATGVDLCLFDGSGTQTRVPLTENTHGTWHGHVDGVRAGQRYGFRVSGEWAPDQGHRHNPAKLLLDPYGRAVDGQVDWRPEVFGHVVDDTLAGDGAVRGGRDSAPYVPRSVVIDDRFDWGEDRPPLVAWQDTVIYEAHVVGLTRQLPNVPEHLRGTYAGVAHPATIGHLQRLGVTTVQLLPVHAFASEPQLVQRGLENYWGYNTLGFFAPHAAHASASSPQEVIDEFKGMVRLLHAAGLEVVLDVVYNHTAEQASSSGATLSWRGLDNRVYYRLDERGQDVDVTGCGNTVDMRHPVPMRMVLDSLRYWVEEMHVDGFRFDLAVALARGRDDAFHPDHPFLMALRTDPLLSRVKLIAEPWDIGSHGWRTGQFPPPFSEWNDRFRDSTRTFWVSDLGQDVAGHPGHGVRDLATRIAGSADLFGSSRRGPLASVSYVTAHDGFTMADLTAYSGKHNEANGEDNRDGSNDNRSWNHGHEGHAGAPAAPETFRRRTVRNLLASLILSSGVPMLTAGDEMGRTQQGNNNAYCQNNEISWCSWDLADWQQNLIDTTAFLVRLRQAHLVLRQREFFPGDPVSGDTLAALHWHGADGQLLTAERWESPATRTMAVVFDGADVGDGQLLMVLHGGASAAPVTLPQRAGVAGWELAWDSVVEHPDQLTSTTRAPGEEYEARASSFHVFRGHP